MSVGKIDQEAVRNANGKAMILKIFQLSTQILDTDTDIHLC
jgi:hypothetical protein